MNCTVNKLILFCLFISFSIINSSYAYELPDLGNPSENVLSPQKEVELGKAFMKELRHSVVILDDPVLNDYLQSLGNKLVAHTSAKNRKFHFFIVADHTVNAFSAPGGYIGINSGTILLTSSESELAGVLAHEVAHSAQHHLEQNIEKAKTMNLPVLAGVLASLVLGTQVHGAAAGDAASGVAASAIAGGTQSMLSFSRENEAEADHIGMKILYNSGFDPNAYPSFFEKMQKIALNDSDNPPAYLLTHPLTSERLADAENRAAEYPQRDVSSSKEYYLIKARLSALMYNRSSDAVAYFQGKINKTKNNYALLYGYSLALIENKQYDLAMSNLNNLLASDPSEVFYKIAKSDALVGSKKINAALDVLQDSLQSKPNYFPLNVQYAETLMAAGQFEGAKSILDKLVVKYPDNSYLYNLLAKVEFKTGQQSYAYLSRAHALEDSGDNQGAMLLLQKALEDKNLSVNTRALLQAELDKVKAMIKRQSTSN